MVWQALNAWRCPGEERLEGCLQRLMGHLRSEGFIGGIDASLARLWVADLAVSLCVCVETEPQTKPETKHANLRLSLRQCMRLIWRRAHVCVHHACTHVCASRAPLLALHPNVHHECY